MIVHGGQPMPAVLDRFDADDGAGLPPRDGALMRAMVRTTVRRWGDLLWAKGAAALAMEQTTADGFASPQAEAADA